MRIAVHFCNCGTNVSEKIPAGKVRREIEAIPGFGGFRAADFLCSETGAAEMEKEIRETRPDRVVVAACSVREHEETFRGVLDRAGMNPFLLQMVNIREHVAWVTADGERATEKAVRCIRAAMKRVALHEPLERRMIDVHTDVLVVGAGPAGIKTALCLAESGRKVCLVEKGPVLGGLPARYEEMFPLMECGPCMLEPALGELTHGPLAERIEVLTLSEVEGVVGSYGNFTATIRKNPRHVSPDQCISCGTCVDACPVIAKNPFNNGMNLKKAIDFPFPGGLPSLPYIDPDSCLRSQRGEDCRICRDACQAEGAVIYDETATRITREIGAIVVATGAGLFDCTRIPNLGYGRVPNVRTSLEFERILAANGPTGGAVTTPAGLPPRAAAIVHCVGSLDARHREYCSGVCCGSAFKFHHLLAGKVPGVRITHYHKALAVAGKEEHRLYRDAVERPETDFVRFDDISELSIRAGDIGGCVVSHDDGGAPSEREFDLVVLCPAIVPSEGTARLAGLLDLPTDRYGFLEELHGRMDAARSRVRGIYIAGTCQSPMDMQKTVNHAVAAAGYILAGLVPGRKLVIEPVVASIDAQRCSACRACISVCPFKAIAFDEGKNAASVNDALCQGCGTCAAACPGAAATCRHFTDEEILAEIGEALA